MRALWVPLGLALMVACSNGSGPQVPDFELSGGAQLGPDEEDAAAAGAGSGL